MDFKITTPICGVLVRYIFVNMRKSKTLTRLCFCLPQQDHSRLKEDRRRQSPDRWPLTQCGCVLSSHLLSPLASCGTASSSISTAVYSECTDEARVFIGPLEKPQDQLVCGPTSYLLPTMDECTFTTVERLNRKQKNIGRQTQDRLQIPIQDETGRRHS